MLVALVATKLAQVANLASRLAKDGSAYFAGNKQWAAQPEVKELQAAEAQWRPRPNGGRAALTPSLRKPMQSLSMPRHG